MKITQDAREYAAQKKLEDGAARKAERVEKAKEFRGAEIYAKA